MKLTDADKQAIIVARLTKVLTLHRMPTGSDAVGELIETLAEQGLKLSLTAIPKSTAEEVQE